MYDCNASVPSERQAWISNWVLMLLIAIVAQFAGLSAHASRLPHRVEIFTLAVPKAVNSRPTAALEKYPGIEITVYHLDGIQRLEHALSANLPREQTVAKRMALQRIQHLDPNATARLQEAAAGAARAVQYGVDRIPATVMDGQFVVYGLTDLSTVLTYYQRWINGKKP